MDSATDDLACAYHSNVTSVGHSVYLWPYIIQPFTPNYRLNDVAANVMKRQKEIIIISPTRSFDFINDFNNNFDRILSTKHANLIFSALISTFY